MIYGGIDPGNNGAFVFIDSQRSVIHAETMPLLDVGKGKKHQWVVHLDGVKRILRDMMALDRPALIVLEKAQVMAPGPGGRSPASPRSMFRYGRGFGALEMALVMAGIPHEVVHPRTWGAAMLKGVEGKDTKARAILRCQRALPKLDLTPGRKRKPHDGLADAGCMALYAMKQDGLRIPEAPTGGGHQTEAPLPPPPPRRS